MPHPRYWCAAKRRQLVLAGAVCGLGFCAHAPRADTTAEWIAGSGSWTTAADWSTNPNYPNNGTPSSTNYQVLIDQPGSGAYTITQTSTSSVDLITLSSTNAALVEASGTMTTGGMSISAGSNIVINRYAQLAVEGNFTNAGNISGQGALLLQGTISPSNIGNVNLSGNEYGGGIIQHGMMNIGAGQTFTTSSGWELAGGTITGGTFAITGTKYLSEAGGTLNGVTLDTPDIAIPYNTTTSLTVLGNLSGVGQFIFDYIGQKIIFDGPSQEISNINLLNGENATLIFIGGASSSGPVTLTVDSNASIATPPYNDAVVISGSNGHGTFINNGFLEGNINVYALDNFINNGTYVGGSFFNGPFTNTSVASFSNYGTMSASNGGTFAILASNSLNATGALISVSNGVMLQIFNHATNAGTIALNNSQLQVDVNFSNQGTISLSNSILHVYDATHTQTSTFNLGDGTLAGSGTVYGSLVMSSDPSQLNFNIGGTNQGTTYDSLAVSGNVTLAGDLNIAFKNGFQNSITAGESFAVLTVAGGDTLAGSFDDVANGGRLETTDGYGSFQVNYESGTNSNEILLSDFVATTPEPASLGLIMGSAFLLRRRPKKRMTR